MSENLDIRLHAAGKGVRLWQLAKKLGISENTLSRRLRNKLEADEREQYLKAIDKVSEEMERET